MRHWQHSTGACRLPYCDQFPGDLLHLFTSCPFTKPIIHKCLPIAKKILEPFPFLRTLFSKNMAISNISSLQSLLDPSTDPVIMALPSHFKKVAIPLLFKASRTIIRPVHRERLRALGLSKYL